MVSGIALFHDNVQAGETWYSLELLGFLVVFFFYMQIAKMS